MLSAPHDFRHNKIARSKRKTNLHAVSARDELSNLQALQHVHDENYHQDIWCLPFNARIKHMVLHFAKYSGKFHIAEECKDIILLGSTVVDAWIITLASANMLNLKLSTLLVKHDEPDLFHLGKSFLSSEFPSHQEPFVLGTHRVGIVTGFMAKACESLDHIEAFDSRGTLERGTLDMAKLCLALAALLKLALVPLVEARWKEIEDKSIF